MVRFAIDIAIVISTVLAMEAVAASVHRYVMHGIGWRWHKSHHEQHDQLFERNDLYAVCFVALSGVLFAIGNFVAPVRWIAVGMAIYGLLYFIVHDGLVHHRWPFYWVPRRGYLKHLVQAHRLHHAVREREGCVSFGFLYAPPRDALVRKLRVNRRIGKDDVR